ncbi:MAG: tellurite resistance TerB family protein [Planctomycetales bacterium]|nr:tellurite resistance TerB family protein [Planctomycetales bacterium]
MFDPERLLGQLLANGLSGKSRRGSTGLATKGKLGMGLLGVAIAAFEHFSQQQTSAGSAGGLPATPAAPPLPPPTSPAAAPAPARSATPTPSLAATPPPPPPLPTSAGPPAPGSAGHLPTRADQAIWLVRAMIAAAAADGHVDAEERGKILDAATNSGMSQEDLSVLQTELNSPRSILELAAIGSTPEMSQQIYAASLLAIEVDTDAERQYLDQLASALQLSSTDIENIQQQLGA